MVIKVSYRGEDAWASWSANSYLLRIFSSQINTLVACEFHEFKLLVWARFSVGPPWFHRYQMTKMSVHTHKVIGQNEHSGSSRRQCHHERAYLNGQPTFSIIFFSVISQLLPLVWTAENSRQQSKSDEMGHKLQGQSQEASLCWGRNISFGVHWQLWQGHTHLRWTEDIVHLLSWINFSCSMSCSRSFLFSRSSLSSWAVTWSWNAFSYE